MRSTLLMLRMSLSTEKRYDGALLMLKLLRLVSPLTSSKLYTACATATITQARVAERSEKSERVQVGAGRVGADRAQHRGDAPLAEKSDAPSGMRRYEKPEEFAPSVAARQVSNA